MQGDNNSPTFSQLQAYGIISLQLAPGNKAAAVRAGALDEYLVVMSTAVVDAYVTSRHGAELDYMIVLDGRTAGPYLLWP